MTETEYYQTQTMVLQIGRAASELDLDGFIAAINHAQTVAPIIDPTLYREAAENMAALKDLAQKLRPIQAAFEITMQKIVETGARQFQTDARRN